MTFTCIKNPKCKKTVKVTCIWVNRQMVGQSEGRDKNQDLIKNTAPIAANYNMTYL